MSSDSVIVDDVRRRRYELSEQYGHDLQRYVEHLREIESRNAPRLVSQLTVVRPAHPTISPPSATETAYLSASCNSRIFAASRQRKIAALDDELLELCGPVWFAELPPLEGADNDYRLLCNELMRLMLAEQLFTFVTAAPVATARGEAQPVAGTNNEAERTLRSVAQARKTGRTNKTFAGARRQTVITSVLESLRQQLPTFTLSTVIGEILRWDRAGRSCFATLMAKRKLSPPAHSVLELLLPIPAD